MREDELVLNRYVMSVELQFVSAQTAADTHRLIGLMLQAMDRKRTHNASVC